jgi:hypothetical protein
MLIGCTKGKQDIPYNPRTGDAMTREFQPGDKVSLPRHIRTVKTVEPHNSVGLRLLYFEDGSCGLVDNFELVEPAMTGEPYDVGTDPQRRCE